VKSERFCVQNFLRAAHVKRNPRSRPEKCSIGDKCRISVRADTTKTTDLGEEASAAPTKHIALLPKYDAIMPDSGKGGLPKKTHSKTSGKSARNRQRKVPVIQPAIKNPQKNARDTNSNGFPGVGKARANQPRRRVRKKFLQIFLFIK